MGLILLLLSLAMALMLPGEALAGAQRIALVIGNSDYPARKLLNPVNDASDVATLLVTKLGFAKDDVIVERDAHAEGQRRALARFEQKLKRAPGAVGFFYFAGHGAQIAGRNYLLPAKDPIRSGEDAKTLGLRVTDVLDAMRDGGASLMIVVLDACRDDPFPGGSRGSRGLQRENPPNGSLIAYAAAAEGTADDDERQRNGVYTRFLLHRLAEPGLTLEQVFKRVRGDVRQATNGRQEPEVLLALEGEQDFYFLGVTPDPRADEESFWLQARQLGSSEAYESYLARYPRGRYAALAQGEIRRLVKQQAAAPVPRPTAVAGAVSAKPDGKGQSAGVAPIKLPEPRFETLYLLVIGVSRYPGEWKLDLAVKDARDFVHHMVRQAGTLYDSAVPRLLINEQASRKNILEGLRWLRESVGEKDTGVVFMAGHGDGVGSSYYFVPGDPDALPLRSDFKTSQELEAWKQANAVKLWVPGGEISRTVFGLSGRSMLFVDTTYAGILARPGQARRGQSTSPILAKALNEINDERGVMVFASSTANELSQEDPAWGNGAFTKAIIEGIRGGADFRKDGLIRPSSLQFYVTERVMELTNREQRPVMFIVGPDDPITAVSAK